MDNNAVYIIVQIQQKSINNRNEGIEYLLKQYQLNNQFYQQSETFFIDLDKILIEMKKVEFEDEEQKNNFFSQRMKPHSQNYDAFLKKKEQIIDSATSSFEKADIYQRRAEQIYDKNY